MLWNRLPASLWRIFLAPATSISASFCRCWHAPAVAIFFLQVLLVERANNAERGNFLATVWFLGSSNCTRRATLLSSLMNSFLLVCTTSNAESAWAAASWDVLGLASNIFTRGGIHPASPNAFLVSLLNERLQIEEAASCWTVECPFFRIEANCFRNPEEETKALAVLTEAERLFIALMTSSYDLGVVGSSKRSNKVWIPPSLSINLHIFSS